MEHTDLEQNRKWVRALKNDERATFNFLFDKYYSRLYYFSNRYLNMTSEAEEVVQDVFLKLWLNKDTLDENLSIQSYLFTIVKNSVLNIIRKRTSRRNYEQNELFTATAFAADSPIDVEFLELSKILQDAIDTLPPKRKEVFLLSRYDELTNKEIADKLGIAVKTVEAQITAALKQLKTILAKSGVTVMLLWIFFTLTKTTEKGIRVLPIDSVLDQRYK